jgi:transposase
MWTKENRGRYDRSQQRYPSDLTAEEWRLVEPLIPPAKRGGGKRRMDMREVVNGIMYILSTGCQWRYLPKDLPSKSTVFRYFDLWNYDGTLLRLHHELYVQCREQADRGKSIGNWLNVCQCASEPGKLVKKRGEGKKLARPSHAPSQEQGNTYMFFK